MADDTSGAVDTELARRYVTLYETLKPADFYKTMRKEFAPHLGLSAGTPPACALTRARTGYATGTGLVVQLEYLSFEDPVAGVTAAVITWLNAKGVHDLHYEVVGNPCRLRFGLRPGRP